MVSWRLTAVLARAGLGGCKCSGCRCGVELLGVRPTLGPAALLASTGTDVILVSLEEVGCGRQRAKVLLKG